MLKRLSLWWRHRRMERLRRAVGVTPEAWELVMHIAACLSVHPGYVVGMLIKDGLRRRAISGSCAIDITEADLFGDTSLRTMIATGLMRQAAERPLSKLQLFDREGLLEVVAANDTQQPASLRTLPERIVKDVVAELRYRCGADIVSRDREVRAEQLVSCYKDNFRLQSAFFPEGREDGLVGELIAVPEYLYDYNGITTITRETAEHYTWSGGSSTPVCDGWKLLAHPDQAVIEERMPAGAWEERHRHRITRQFFYVLEGTLTVEVEGTAHVLRGGHGIEIPPGVAHQARNTDIEQDARFLVISHPGHSRADREAAPL